MLCRSVPSLSIPQACCSSTKSRSPYQSSWRCDCQIRPPSRVLKSDQLGGGRGPGGVGGATPPPPPVLREGGGTGGDRWGKLPNPGLNRGSPENRKGCGWAPTSPSHLW